MRNAIMLEFDNNIIIEINPKLHNFSISHNDHSLESVFILNIVTFYYAHGFLKPNLVPVNIFHFYFMNGFHMAFQFAHNKRIKARN